MITEEACKACQLETMLITEKIDVTYLMAKFFANWSKVVEMKIAIETPKDQCSERKRWTNGEKCLLAQSQGKTKSRGKMIQMYVLNVYTLIRT